MESKKYVEDLAEIKSLMNKSSRFMSLSGLSGIMAGIYGLIASFIAYRLLAFQVLPGISVDSMQAEPYSRMDGIIGLLSAFSGGLINELTGNLFLVGLVTLVLALSTGWILTVLKARKHQERLWTSTSKRLIINFLIPLIVGAIFTFVLLQYGIIGLIAPSTLIFYGLALINASKYTLGDIRYLGISIIIIGLINTQFIGYGIFFWALGFGVFHIIYGSLMYFKYDRH